jgi:hypothetical protein
MADPAAKPPPAAGAAGGAAPKAEKSDRPLGPDGKPIPGPEQMRQIQAARKMGQQQAQVDEVIGIMHKTWKMCWSEMLSLVPWKKGQMPCKMAALNSKSKPQL